MIYSLNFIILCIAISVNMFLMVVVYSHDRKSATNRSYAALSFVMSAWLAASFLSVTPETNLLWARITVFLATAMSALFFLLARVLPSPAFNLGKIASISVLASTMGVMAVTLTPLVFRGVETGTTASPQLIVGPGIGLFGALTTFYTIAAVFVLFRRIRHSLAEDRAQLRLVLTGIVSMVGLLVATVLIPVAVFQNDYFVALIPLYTLVFLGTTAYAIVKYRLFSLKVVATEAFAVILWIILFSKALAARSAGDQLIDGSIFLASVVFGILLIHSVRMEVKQREELERLTKKLEDANHALEDLSRFKSQLLSLASHQIKSPLAIIKGYLTILLDGLYGPIDDKIRATLEKVKESADGLTHLIENLLNLRKAEEGKMDYRFAPADISKLAEGIVETFRVLAYQKGLLLDYKAPEAPVMIEADVDKLHEVFQNLVDNSIKYTPKGFVRVAIEAISGKVRFVVSDSGLGIPAELLPRLFGEFVRDERVRKTIKGTGFGLYVAKKIVDAHGGKIWAESPGEGKGSTFVVELPLHSGK